MSARVVLVENSWTDGTKDRDPEVLDSLKLVSKEAQGDANQALESLAMTRGSIDDKFDCAARRFKDLEQATGRSAPRFDSGPLSDGEPEIQRKGQDSPNPGLLVKELQDGQRPKEEEMSL